MKKYFLLLASALILGACSSTTDSVKSDTTEKEEVAEVSTDESGTEKTADVEETEEPTETEGDFVTDVSDVYFDGTILKGNAYSIKITDYKIINVGEKGNEYGQNPVIAFWYDTLVNENYDNSTPIQPMIAWITNFSAVQDNNPNAVNELNVASLPDDQFLDAQTQDIKPGGTVKCAVAYELTDIETPVNLIAQDMLGTVYGSKEFAIK